MSFSCRKWDVIGIPCCHVIAAMKARNMNPYEYYEYWHLTGMYQKMYSDVIHATRDRKQWEQHLTGRVIPPLASKQLGRPKKNKIRVEDQHRKRRVITCSCCREGSQLWALQKSASSTMTLMDFVFWVCSCNLLRNWVDQRRT